MSEKRLHRLRSISGACFSLLVAALLLLPGDTTLENHAGEKIVAVPRAAGEAAGIPVSEKAIMDAPVSLPAGVPDSWFQQVSQKIAQEEYHINYDSAIGTHQSPNRKQNIRVKYYADGFELEPLETTKDGWRLRLRLEGIGKGDNPLRPRSNPGEAAFHATENRMEVDHDGFFIEYINTVEGMRQNFIVEHPPSGEDQLRVQLRAEGELRPKISSCDNALFVRGDEELLEYKGLKVWDAAGRELDAHMEAAGDLLALVVDDADAEYPVTIDPVSTTPNWSAEGNQAGSGFGYSVASAGDVNNDGFDDVIIGAQNYDNGQLEEGRAYVYLGSAAGLAATPVWTVESNSGYAYFGNSVASAGDVNGDGYSDIIVGAYNYDQQRGKAVLYYGTSGGVADTVGWYIRGELAASLGSSVASAGDVNNDGYSDILIGAYSAGRNSAGEAYVYHGSATGPGSFPNWTGSGGILYGYSVAGAGDVNGDGYDDVVIGAHGLSTGEAFVYHGSSAGLKTASAWRGRPGGTNFYGFSVSGAGDVNGDGYSDIIIGDHGYDKGPGQTNQGRAYVYHGSPGGISLTPAWIVDGRLVESAFGWSVDDAGDVNGDGFDDVIVGAVVYSNPTTMEGAAFIYYGSSGGLDTAAAWSVEGNQASVNFGSCVAGAGDVNGDSFSDVILGVYQYDKEQTNEGGAFVYHGGSDFPGGILSGVIVDDMQLPIAGAGVKIDNSISVTTNSSGAFKFPGRISAGIHTLTVSATGYQTATFDLTMPDGNKHVVLGLNPAGNPPTGPYTICGTVTENDGNGPPLDAVTVEILQGGNVVHTTSTNSQGKFCSAPLDGGNYQARFTKSGYRTFTADLNLNADKQIVVSLLPSNLE